MQFDNGSRRILAGGEFKGETTEKSISLLSRLPEGRKLKMFLDHTGVYKILKR